MDQQTRERLRELEAKATKAEWLHDDGEIMVGGAVLAQVFGADDYPCCDENIDAECKANAELICLMRNHLRELLEAEEKSTEAASHLRVALVQALPTDDQLIIEHIRLALGFLEGK